jgi:hypothetical protein
MERFTQYAGYAVAGRMIAGMVRGFGQFQLLASEVLLAEGLGQKGPDGVVQVDPQGWYPLERYLRAFARTRDKVGDAVVHQLGVAVVKGVEWLPGAETLPGMVQLFDVGYHLHHRQGGQVMFDPATGAMREGIGHYAGRQVDARTFHMECDTPYPCAFDKGMLLGGLKRNGTKAALLHDEGQPCRARGDARCVYVLRQQEAPRARGPSSGPRIRAAP